MLVHWDYGYLKYQWRSQSAIKTRVRLRSTDDPQEPLPDTLAADEDIVQEWDGIQMPAENWCSSEPPGITLREMKRKPWSVPYYSFCPLLFFRPLPESGSQCPMPPRLAH